MTPAHLKRILVPGVKLTLLEANIKHKFLGQTREVTKANTVGVELGAPPFNSALDWPKSSELEFNTDREFTIRYGQTILKYRIEA